MSAQGFIPANHCRVTLGGWHLRMFARDMHDARDLRGSSIESETRSPIRGTGWKNGVGSALESMRGNG